MVELTDEQFEQAVESALGLIPTELLALVENVALIVEDEPPPGEDPELLGLYDGLPLTEADSGWSFVLPNRILIFQGPLQRWCADRDELEGEIAVTVVHEIAHHFGMEEDRLPELGWD